jgi:hypothetical protein
VFSRITEFFPQQIAMTPTVEVGYILNDCFLAVGQALGSDRRLDSAAIAWWHRRYRHAFLHAMIQTGNSWRNDRSRVTAVGRFLGQRALHHAGGNRIIDVACAAKASADVESGCQMSALRDGVVSGRAGDALTDADMSRAQDVYELSRCGVLPSHHS